MTNKLATIFNIMAALGWVVTIALIVFFKYLGII